MVENKNWIGVGTVALLLILAGIGYAITDHSYYCSEKGIVMECLRFSSTGARCYPSLTSNTGYKDCSSWTKLKTEDTNNILNKTSENITIPVLVSSSGVVKYRCDQTNCTRIQ